MVLKGMYFKCMDVCDLVIPLLTDIFTLGKIKHKVVTLNIYNSLVVILKLCTNKIQYLNAVYRKIYLFNSLN